MDAWRGYIASQLPMPYCESLIMVFIITTHIFINIFHVVLFFFFSVIKFTKYELFFWYRTNISEGLKKKRSNWTWLPDLTPSVISYNYIKFINYLFSLCIRSRLLLIGVYGFWVWFNDNRFATKSKVYSLSLALSFYVINK